MLRLLPKHKHFLGPTRQITDPAELAIAKDKLLFLAQFELFRGEFKQLQSRILVKGADYSPFIGPAGIIRSTGRTQHLAEISFETKHSIILDYLDYLRSIVHGVCGVGSPSGPPCD